MIDLKVTALGGPEIGKRLADADAGIRQVLRDELAQIGEEVVSRAQANAPKRTGRMAAKIIWFFGKRGKRTKKLADGTRKRMSRVTEREYKDGRIYFTAMPTGRVAHLVERPVNATFYQSPGRRGKHYLGREIGPFAGEKPQGPRMKYQRTLRIKAQPFFMPAVESVGGASGVNARLQKVLDRLAAEGTR